MKTRNQFTLIEILAVIAIIGILAGALAYSLRGKDDEARKTQAQAAIKTVKTVMLSYQNSYGKPPESIEDLFKKNNKRNIEFFDYDELPQDPFSATGEPLKIIPGVASVTTKKVKNDRYITGGELGGNSFIVYSVGPNEKPDGSGDLQGGINDGLKEGKDDIAEYVSF